jgi:hypothetical protein
MSSDLENARASIPRINAASPNIKREPRVVAALLIAMEKAAINAPTPCAAYNILLRASTADLEQKSDQLMA